MSRRYPTSEEISLSNWALILAILAIVYALAGIAHLVPWG